MIKIIKGEDKVINVKMNLKNGLGFIIGPKDLTGKTITVKYRIPSEADLQEVSGLITGPETQGRFSFSLTDVETELLPLGVFNFDVYLVEGSDTDIEKVTKLVVVEDRLR